MPIVRNANAVVAMAMWNDSSQPGRAIENCRVPSENAASMQRGDAEQQRRHAASCPGAVT